MTQAQTMLELACDLAIWFDKPSTDAATKAIINRTIKALRATTAAAQPVALTYDERVEMKRLHDDILGGEISEFDHEQSEILMRALSVAIATPSPLPAPDDASVHLSHCNQGEYLGSCKYGNDDCPAFNPLPAPGERTTFIIPDGHEAVRDEHGRATTGEVRSISPAPGEVAGGGRTAVFDGMIANLIELDKQRSPGPWRKTHDNVTANHRVPRTPKGTTDVSLIARCDTDWSSFMVDMTKASKNARFIVALENAWPKILTALATLSPGGGVVEALKESQNLLKTIFQLNTMGSVGEHDWEEGGVGNLIEKRIAKNRAALSALPPAQADGVSHTRPHSNTAAD